MSEKVLELDAKDKKILEQLDLDARHGSSEIARKAGLRKDAVGYRIRRLEKSGVIKGYYSVLNIAKLGFETYKLMLTFQNTTSGIEKEVIGYFAKSPHVGWLVSCDGKYNLMIVCWVRNGAVLDQFFSEFLTEYAQYVRERDIIQITENHSCPKSYLFGKERDESPDVFYGGEPKCEADGTDLKIMQELANDARMPLSELAGKVGLTGEAVAYRLKQLKKRNVVQAFRPIINTPMLGYQYYNVLFRLQRFENLEEIFAYFKQHPNVIYFVKYLGTHDIGIDLEVKGPEELRTVLRRIKDTFSEDIESYDTVLVYQEHKLSYFPN
jgi:DNA-binding Lrp family transcriptional regulator